IHPPKRLVVVRCVIRLATLAHDDPLRTGTGETGRRVDVFLVIALRLLRQAALPVLKHAAVVGKTEPLAGGDSFQCRPTLTFAAKDLVTELVENLLIAELCFGKADGLVIRRSRRCSLRRLLGSRIGPAVDRGGLGGRRRRILGLQLLLLLLL